MAEMTSNDPDSDSDVMIDVQIIDENEPEPPATQEQVLSWLIEKLTLQGEVGLATDWLPEHFSAAWIVDVDRYGNVNLPNKDSDLRCSINRLNLEARREEWLERRLSTRNARAVFPEIHAVVEERLLARGIPQERLQALKPRDKLILFAEFDCLRTHLQPKFAVYLVSPYDELGARKETTKLYFPYSTRFGRFLNGLRTYSTCPYTLQDGPWIYQLIGADKAIVPGLPKYTIADEQDFREFKERLQSVYTPMACIYHSVVGKLFEERIVSQAGRKIREATKTMFMFKPAGKLGDHEEEPVMDENGEPYFQPDVDWKGLVKHMGTKCVIDQM
ncbi:MAG: hypothetical protein M1816_002733 [Peltula sp. TS41687]|nr:MAG: hypothetical protein M1816_002733 [Peltula sp. TS41687]